MQFCVHIACVKYHSSGSRARVGGAPALRCAPVGAVRLRLQFTCGRFPGRVPPPPGAPTAPRWALRLPPPCALVTACGWRGLYAPAAPPNTPFGAIAARLSALRAAKLSFGAIRCWSVAPSRRGYRRSFYPRCGVLRTCAPTPGALCGGNPPAPPIRIKRIVRTARDAYTSCPAIQPNRRENNHARACQSGGDPPSPPLFARLIRQTNTNNNINNRQ